MRILLKTATHNDEASQCDSDAIQTAFAAVELVSSST